MKTIVCFIRLIIVSAAVILPAKSRAYEGEPTHFKITEEAVPASKKLTSRTDDLLLSSRAVAMRDLLGTRYKWISGNFNNLIIKGSVNEDAYPTEANVRAHFHDAVTNQGAALPTQPHSALYRAIGNDPLFGWDWIDARDYFRLGLTSPRRADREENLGRMFYSLGRIAHLLQDMSVPSHVRNDLHLPVGISRLFFEKDLYEQFWRNSSSIPTTREQPLSFPQLTDFWDGDLVDVNYLNPDPGNGLAEFTNRHFLSQDTNFGDETPFFYPYQKEPACEPYAALEEPGGKLISVDYYRCTFHDHTDNRPFTIQHMTALSVYDYEVSRKTFFDKRVFTLNNRCFEDYGNILIPKAIRYTAGLFDYFFRGSFEAPADETFVETLAPDLISLHIKNASGEAMTNGTLYLYQDDGDEEVPEAENWLWDSPVTAPVSSWAGGDIYPGDAFQNVWVWLPEGKAIEDITFTLVFIGQLGSEQDAVVARRFRVDPVLRIEVAGQTHGSQGETLSVTFKITNLTKETVLAQGSTVEFTSSGGAETGYLSSDLPPGGEQEVTFPVYLPYGTTAEVTVIITAAFSPGYTRRYTVTGIIGVPRM